jgi:hypothetical protein
MLAGGVLLTAAASLYVGYRVFKSVEAARGGGGGSSSSAGRRR